MKSKPLIISGMFLFILLTVSLVHAAIEVNTYSVSNDFKLMSAYDEVKVCSCSTKQDSVVITNTGSWPAIFTIYADSKYTVITSEKTFELISGQSKEIVLYITADCNKGSEELQVSVTSNLGPKKTLIKNIINEKCQNIEAWTNEYDSEIDPCQSKNIEINIHNIGPFSENYILSSNYDEYILYNTNTVNLDPNQYAKITATLKFDCEIYGQKDIAFNVHSEKNKLTATLNTPINILQKYDYDVKINSNKINNDTTNIQICNRMANTSIPISITNNGSTKNEYTIDISKLPRNTKILGLNNNKITLNSGETKIFHIEVDSTKYRYEDKSKEIIITITPKIGDIIKKINFNLNFMPCYEHEIIIYDYDNSKKYPLRTCEDYNYSYNINLKNNGRYIETYDLTIVNPTSDFKLSKTKTKLSPKDNDIITLLLNGPSDNEYHNVIVKITSSKGISEYVDVWVKAYDGQSCHNTIIKKTEYKINYDTEYISIPVKNIGLADNTYVGLWTGTDLITKDITVTEINKSQTKNIILNLNSNNKNESKYIGVLTLKTAQKAEYSQEIQITLKDKSNIRKTFEYLAFGNTCKQFSLYSIFIIIILVILIIAILIRGPNYPYKFKNRLKSKTSTIIFLIALLIIGIVLVVIIAGLPQTQTQVYNLTTNNSELTYEWLQDNTYSLDASKLFYDPENSTLKYEVTGLDNIKAISSGNKITFYPDKGWSGIEHATIYAYDNIGDSVKSPKFTLIVRDVPKKSLIELYGIYCWYVNLAIYALILLLVFIAVFVKQKKRGRKK
ncbi:MAG: hypothetical protein ACP5N1_01990 [Candidatus Woesearchaeota archaeon]